MAGQSRFFLTEKSKIASNIESGVINESDFIITSDTHELYFVKEDGTYFAITTVQDPSGEGGYVRGNSTGTTRNHVAVWGDNGFEIKDSGYTIASNVPINAKFTDTTYSPATTLLSGLMSKDDKAKLDGINVDAIKTQLQSLYVKLGGDSSETASSIEDWIDKIEDVAESNANESIGTKIFVVTITVDQTDPYNIVYTADKTYEEALEAYGEGYFIVFRCGEMLTPALILDAPNIEDISNFSFVSHYVDYVNNMLVHIRGTFGTYGIGNVVVTPYSLNAANNSYA